MNQIRVMLVDDHAVVRSGLRHFLEQKDDVSVAGEAESGEQAYQLFTDLNPDVSLMNVSMPGMGGLESLHRILTRNPEAKVIMFSIHENVTYAVQALTAGAVGYLAKSVDTDVLDTAIREVLAGNTYLSPEMAQKIALQSVIDRENPTQRLTVREFEVFRLLAEGNTVEEIANTLNVSSKTVANYQTLIKNKLEINTAVELVRLALKYNVISND